jgi:hypothetical protein
MHSAAQLLHLLCFLNLLCTAFLVYCGHDLLLQLLLLLGC